MNQNAAKPHPSGVPDLSTMITHLAHIHSYLCTHTQNAGISSHLPHLIASSSSCSQLLDSVFVPLVYLLHRFISRASRVATSTLIMKASSCTGEFGYTCTHNRPRVVLYIYICLTTAFTRVSRCVFNAIKCAVFSVACFPLQQRCAL